MAIVENYTEPETTTKQHPATGFDVEAWLQDAAMPEHSADVYKRADVIGELEVLQRQITLRREANQLEKTAHGDKVLAEYERRYAELVDTFTGSLITIYARAISPDERRAIRKEAEEASQGKDPDEQNALFGYGVLARAIVAVRPFEGERTPVSWNATTIRTLENRIGGTQMSAVLDAHRIAQNQIPAVDADFLQKPSGGDAGQG